jgi:hypothetical protein
LESVKVLSVGHLVATNFIFHNNDHAMLIMSEDTIEMVASDQLSDDQERVLAILPIPSAILSILGSSAIIYMALKSRQQRKWTPYKRLLLAMSICDIIASITISVATFLRPQETSSRVWAFGNAASCSAIGFLNQMSFSAVLYNGTLSIYFLLKARFGFKNEYIAKCIEPMMHIIAIGYPLITATNGAMMGLYGEAAAGLGCWITDYGCDENGENCISQLIAWFYYALPALFVFATLLVNNLVISIFVWRQTRTRSKLKRNPPNSSKSPDSIVGKRATFESFISRNDSLESLISDNDPLDISEQNNTKAGCFHCEIRARETESGSSSFSLKESQRKRASYSHHKRQNRRLKLVSSQAFLFVASYFVCNVWSGIMALAESAAKTDSEEHEMMVKYYPIAIFQAALLPLQGLLNMMVYIRPKYLKWRHEFPSETRLWATKRAIFGDEVKPTKVGALQALSPSPQNPMEKLTAEKEINGNANSDEEKETDDDGVELGTYNVCNAGSFKRLPRDMISSLTASTGDFDHVIEEDEEDMRWGKRNEPASSMPAKTTPRSLSNLRDNLISSLEIISETLESFFEPISSQAEKEPPHGPQTRPISRDHLSEKRWCSSSSKRSADYKQKIDAPSRKPSPHFSTLSSPRMPQRICSDFEMADEPPPPKARSYDSPIRTPARKQSPHNITISSPGSSGLFSASFVNSIDTPISQPQRRLSPPPVHNM